MKILLPEASSMSAREIVYALGNDHQIDVIDPSPVCQLRFSSLVRRWHKCPSYTRQPEAYLEFLLRLLQQEAYDVLLPTHEQIYLLSRFRESLSRHVGMAVPDFETIERLQSKAEFTRLLDQIDLPQPPTRIVRDRESFLKTDLFPCFAKLDFSTAGNGVRKIDDVDQLTAVAAEFEASGVWETQQEVLVQSAATGQQFTTLGIFDSGRMVSHISYLVRQPGLGGWGVNGESIDQPKIVDVMARLGEHLRYHGPLFVDYFLDPKTGQPLLIEANPHFAYALFPKMCGVDVGEQMLQLSMGQSVAVLPSARTGVRFHQTFLMMISAASGGANRRELWRIRTDARRHQGFFENSEDTITRPAEDFGSRIPSAAVTALLFMRPSASHWLIRRTLANFTLSAEGAQRIREMPLPSVGDGD